MKWVSNVFAVFSDNIWMKPTNDFPLLLKFLVQATFSLAKDITSTFLTLYILKNVLDSTKWSTDPFLLLEPVGRKYTSQSTFATCSCLCRTSTGFFIYSMSLYANTCFDSNSVLSRPRIHTPFVVLLHSAKLDKFFLNVFNSNFYCQITEVSVSTLEALKEEQRSSRHSAVLTT